MTERTQPTGGAIRVGDFVVDPRSGELRGDSGRQLLSGQPLHVLLALAEQPGQVVTRDELRARLWPADTYVDFEHGLNAVVKRLRDALGDSADTPRYIETVPRRGYRLIAPVATDAPTAPEAAAAAAQTAAQPSAAATPRSVRRSAATRALVAAAVVLMAVAIVYVIRFRPPEVASQAATPAGAAHPNRLTFGPGLQTDAAWSPDGRRIAYAADRDGNFDLFSQTLDGGDPIRITRTPANETQPAWSPDGQRLVFRSDEDGGGLFTIDLGGASRRRITDGGYQPTWIPDGREIAYAGTQLSALYVVKADGGEPPRQILKDQLANGAWSSFAVHPDGRIGVFGIQPEGGLGFYLSDREHRRLHSVTAETRLPEEFLRVLGRVVWSKAGDAMFIESYAAGVPSIWRADVDPVTQVWHAPVRLATGVGAAERAAISPDGRALAFTNVQSTTRAWVFPFDAGGGTAPGEGRPLTDEDASISGLALSRDGAAIYYLEERPGREIQRGARTDVATGETTALFSGGVTGFVPAPDGRAGAYMLTRAPPDATRTGAVEYALAWRDAKGNERLLSTWSRSAVVPTDVRNDGQAVVATSMRRPFTGSASIVEWSIGPTPASAPRRVLLDAEGLQFWQGRYSPNERWLAFVILKMEGEGPLEMGVVRADGRAASTWTRIAAEHPWPDKPRWSPDGRKLYFLSRAASGSFNLWGVRFDPDEGVAVGAPFEIRRFESPLWHVDPFIGTCEMGVSKDRLVLPMRTVKGSIWLLKMSGT
jgi:Tol biopolymer transport system component/DNA-binding winged helix-turn-helix (wHTH) protein